MNKHQRVRAALLGQPVDRLPYAFWTHFPLTDLDPDALAEATVDFAQELDIDFVKTMPNGQFCTEDWGVVSDFSEVAKGGVAKAIKSAINAPEDWLNIGVMDIRQGAFGRELEHLKKVCAALSADRPILATAFSPLTIAQKLAGSVYRQHLESHPHWVAQALTNIATTMAHYVDAALDIGCSGVFFATQESSTQCVTEATYRQFGVPHDLTVLAAAKKGWFNVIHMHGEDIMFDLLKDYPVTALNWHIGETEPLLANYASTPGHKPVVGGLRRMALTEGDLGAIRTDIAGAIAATAGRGLLLGPACVIRHPVDREILKSVIEEIKRVS